MAFDEVSSPVLAKKFSAIDFNAEEYVKSILSKCDIYRTLYDQRNNIQTLGEETAVSLKKNVYKNYRQFIDTAKEISYLEAEMYQLSHLLTEQKALLADQIETVIFDQPKAVLVQKEEKNEEQNSKKKDFIASLKATKDVINQLILKELILNGELTEYDPETYSSIHKINAWLMTDTLLITTLLNNGKSTILTTFDLSDLAVVNVRDGQGAKNAFKVLYALETRMFSAPTKDMKLAWLDKIDRAKKNYGKTVLLDPPKMIDKTDKDKKSEGETEEKKIKPTISTNFPKIIESKSFPNLLNADWLNELPEDLDMSIAQRDFEGAVLLVEKARNYISGFPESPGLLEIKKNIDSRVQTLIGAFEKSLDNSNSSRHVSLRSIRVYILYLIRLGQAKLACKLFFRNRGFEIKNSFKQLKMEGAVTMYIAKLAEVFVNALIETGKEYKKIYPQNKNASAYLVWVHNELQCFTDKFSRQVFTRSTNISTIAACVHIALTECQRLESIGVDLTFDIQHMLLKDVMAIVFDTRDQLLERGKMRAMEDTWDEIDYSKSPDSLNDLKNEFELLRLEGIDAYFRGNVVCLSSSTLIFAKDILAFLFDGMQLYSSELHCTFIRCLVDIFKAQSIQFESLLKEQIMKPKRNMIFVNAEFVFSKVLSCIATQLEGLVRNDIAILFDISEELTKLRKFLL
ncbi:exocyst complex component 8 [Hydra vulgaris]|uniref:exocyst complex component 8 n=1 Tax=Hydra vulgaris TaxID=6087 RepID=UPI001F5F7E8C|nr:exocyst complex component 8 [Hydra vulgaris]